MTAQRVCARCGAVHGELGAVDRLGEWHRDLDIHRMNSAVGRSLFNGDFPDTKIATVVATSTGATLCRRCALATVRPTMPKPDPTKRAMKRAAKRGQTQLELGP